MEQRSVGERLERLFGPLHGGFAPSEGIITPYNIYIRASTASTSFPYFGTGRSRNAHGIECESCFLPLSVVSRRDHTHPLIVVVETGLASACPPYIQYLRETEELRE
jgi:hypothetical protein